MYNIWIRSICDAVGLLHWIQNRQGEYEDWDDWWFNWDHSAASYLLWNVFCALAKLNLYIVYLYRIYVITQETKYTAKPMLYYITIFFIFGQFICLCSWCYYYHIAYYCCEIWKGIIYLMDDFDFGYIHIIGFNLFLNCLFEEFIPIIT